MPPSNAPPAPIIGNGLSLDGARVAAAGCGLLVILVGLLVLAGWAMNSPVLKAVVADWTPMQPLTALAFTFAGMALLLALPRSARGQQVMVAVVAALACSALFQSLSGFELGVDGLLFHDRVMTQEIEFPGRMAEASAVAFLLFSVAVTLARRPGRDVALSIMASFGLVLAGVGLMGYLFGSAGLARYGSYASMAVHTSAAFLLLFFGLLLLKAEDTWMGTVLSARVGGVVARRMVPAVIGFPLAVGLIVTYWEGAWGTAEATAVGVSMVLVMAGLALAVLWVARTLNSVDERGEMAGRALRRAEARFRSVVDTAVDAMVVIDEAGTIQSFNRAAETMFGWPAQEAIGRNVSVLVPEPHASQHDGYIRSYLRTGVAHIIGIGREVEGRRADGTLVPLDLAIAEWRDGDQRFFTGILRDISARRAAENRLREAKEAAEKANRDKSRFLAAASHDLRQPVQAIVLMASVMAEQLRGHPAEKLMANTTMAIDALQNLLSGLLDVSRLDAGIVQAKESEFLLADLIERLVAEYQLLATGKGLSLRRVHCSSLVRTDPVLLERILRNLIENALRYTERGGIVIGCRRRGRMVAVKVVDSGIGIAAAEQEAVFQEFYQVGNPERDRAKGLGLGLTIVRRLVDLLGLRLEVSSRLGRGTCFAIELPVVGQARPAKQAQPPQAAPPNRETIMIVDDEAIVRMGVSSLLQSWGFHVVEAADANEAVAWVKENRKRCPDLIIADYRLREGHTGINAIREVQLACGRKVRAIVITGDTAPESLAEMARSGFEVAHKPVPPDRLRQLITAAGA